MLERIFAEIEENFDEMVDIRRDFHMNPELSFQEVRTPQKIAEYHQKLGLQVRTGVGGRGVVATLEGGKPGKTVALRADFDALPIQDQKDVPYKSTVPNVMHACGHDAHTSTLLIVAKVLSNVKDDIKGNIVFIHQFAEELTPGGAKPMIEDGCLDGVDAIFGTHLWSNFQVGEVGYTPGPMMAAADKFEIEIIGKGGHGASPHETIDPIVIGSQLISQLQTIVSRKVDPLKSAVVTVGTFHSGNAFNVIPGKAKITGTVRTFDDDIRVEIEKAIGQLVKSTCEGYGADFIYDYGRGYPALINHVKETELFAESANKVVGDSKAFKMEPVMGGEDFAYYLQKLPGTFFFTGVRNESIGAGYPHHHEMFDIDERGMVVAAKLLTSVSLQYLEVSKKPLTINNGR
jgi:amidohydrolase